MTSDVPLHLATALRRRDYLVSPWPWRSLAYLATTLPIAGVLSIGLLVVGAPLMAVVNATRQGRPVELPILVFLTVVALTVLALAPVVSIAVAAIERWRLRPGGPASAAPATLHGAWWRATAMPGPGGKSATPSCSAASCRWRTGCCS